MRKLLIIKFLFIVNLLSFSQNWIENPLRNTFKDKVVQSIAFQGNNAFLLVENLIYKFNKTDSTIKLFNIDKFSGLTKADERIYSLNKNGDSILSITNDSTKNYTRFNEISLGFNDLALFTNNKSDFLNKDNLVFENDNLDKGEFKIFSLNDTQFNVVTIQNESDSMLIVELFIIDSTIYYITIDKDPNKPTILNTVSNNEVKRYSIVNNSKATNYSYYHSKNILYLMNNYGEFFLLENNAMQSKKLIFKEMLYRNFNFVKINNVLYITDYIGLIIYDLKNNKSQISKPKDFNKNCFFAFENIYFDNKSLWIFYGGPIKSNCKGYNLGFAIYELF